jgi:hypothetical protein
LAAVEAVAEVLAADSAAADSAAAERREAGDNRSARTSNHRDRKWVNSVMNKEKDLSALVEEFERAAGSNLTSLVLYGSAAGGEFHEEHSDLNVLGVFERLDAEALRRLNPVVAMWTGKGHPAPLLLTLSELNSAADIFAIEFLDIAARRRTLAGADVFASLEIPLTLHSHQVERELRVNVLRLRQAALLAGADTAKLRRLMLDSVAAFCVLFRHALLALGEKAPDSRRESCVRLAALLGFDSAPFTAVLDVRETKQPEKWLTAETFAAYLAAVSAAANEFDRRMAG